MALTYKQEIKKLLIDKLLIALILAVFGLLASLLIERYKSTQSFSEELNKLRVEKIAEVWESVFIYESKIDRLYSELLNTTSSNIRDLNHIDSIFSARIDFLEKERIRIMELGDKNRFWIGESSYEDIKNYLVLTSGLSGIIHLWNLEQMEEDIKRQEPLTHDYNIMLNEIQTYKKALEIRKQARMSIIKIRDKLLKE
jgi:hypothetical protein